MWAMEDKPKNCTKLAFVNFLFRSFAEANPAALHFRHRPPFAQSGNQNAVGPIFDPHFTKPVTACANMLPFHGASMARHNGRGSSRPSVLIRTGHPRVSAKNCLVFFLVALLSCAFLAVAAFAQDSDVENIHVTPRIEPRTVDPASVIISESLRSRIPVVKSKVDLVLVPVTVTDPMNRLVTGLDKENFQVFEGKEPQEV